MSSTPLLRVVFDTNIYVSAALRGAPDETALQLADARRLHLLTSEVLLDELAGKLRHKFNWPEPRIALFLKTIRALAEIVKPGLTLNVIPSDPDDDRVLECAVAGNAALIVTSDRDLLRLESFEGIGIITARQLTFYGLGSESE